MEYDQRRFFNQVVDLSHPLHSGMSNISGRPVAFFPLETFTSLHTWSGGKYSMESRMILMPEHTGTHLDAPRHFDPDGAPIDKVPLESLILPGHLLDFTSKRPREAITAEDFEECIKRSSRPLHSGTALLAWTGVDKDW